MTAPDGHDPMRPRFATVLRSRRESHDTVTLELVPPDGSFAFAPGQFNMLYGFGTGESAISISGDPDHAGTLVHTIRSVGSVTAQLTSLKKGDVVGVRGPFGRGWPLEAARGRDLVVVAGGIGLAPLRPLILAALNHRERYRRVAILIGARTPDDLIFRRDTARWRGRLDTQVEVTVDRGDAEWRGDVGVVTTLIRRLNIDPARTTAMLCGPEIMMRYTARDLAAYGVPASDVWMTLERNMKCGVGFCGHCQLGPRFLCKDGPVFRQDELGAALDIREL